MSSWGCLLYAAFCLSTARLAVQAQPAQTAQSEQRQDIGVTAELLRTGWGRALLILAGVLAVVAGVETGRRSVRLDFRERFTTEAHAPGAGHLHQGAGRGGLRRARRRVRAGRRLPAEGRGAVQREAGQGAGRGLPFVASSAYGPWLLAGLASGLVCYGLYCLLEARYRDLTPGR